MFSIDINCDMGEGIGNDEKILPFISSASIACGYHAGNAQTMQDTVGLCLKYKVAVGAHPSYRDKENFGRSEINLSPDEVYQLVIDQVNSLLKIVKSQEATLHHIKPHGALYNMAAKDRALAAAIAKAVKDVDASLIVYGLAGSHSIAEAQKEGLKTASEVFADRTYQDDGSLTPRKQTNALIEDGHKAIAQSLQMIKSKTVNALSGKKVSILAETICIHGDGIYAVEFAKDIHHRLIKEGIDIKAI